MSDSTYIHQSFGKHSRSGGPAVEIRVFWGGELLERFELSPPRSFFLGDASESKEHVDFTIPEAVAALGATVGALVRSEGGVTKVIVPEGARAVWRDEKPNRFIPAEMVAEREVVLGARGVDVHLSGLVFSIKMTEREASCPRAALGDGDGKLFAFFGLSVLGNAALVASLMMSAPAFGLTDDEGIDRDRIIAMMSYLDASAERERRPEETPAADAPGGGGPGATPTKGEAGAMGKPESRERMRRASGTQAGSDPRPATSRDEMIREAQNFGIIGMLNSSRAAPTVAPWDDDGVGQAAFAGGFFGEFGDQHGSGGLTLTGLGSGGGDRGDSIAFGGIGTCPNGFCSGLGGEGGFGRSGALTRRAHVARGPQVRPQGESIVSGHLPPEVVQRVVRQSFGRFRGCYEDGLRTNPNLEGRVTARFVIARDGSVASVQSGGSNLPDAKVVACVLRNYQALSFPSPGDGVVTVTYPLMFSPSA
jgi:hypothetical protein